ncbi:unnamed protein product, partial [Rotaria sp. Silwood1]
RATKHGQCSNSGSAADQRWCCSSGSANDHWCFCGGTTDYRRQCSIGVSTAGHCRYSDSSSVDDHHQ